MSKIKSYAFDEICRVEFLEALPDFQREPDYLPDDVAQEFLVRASDESDELPF